MSQLDTEKLASFFRHASARGHSKQLSRGESVGPADRINRGPESGRRERGGACKMAN